MKRKSLIILLVLKWFVAAPLFLAVATQLLANRVQTGQWQPTLGGLAGAHGLAFGCGSLAFSFFFFIALARYTTVWSERADTAVQAGDLERASQSLRWHRCLNAFLIWMPFYRPIDPSIPERLAERCMVYGLYPQAIELYDSLPSNPLPSAYWEWQVARWHNYACALVHSGRESEATAWVEKEEALLAAHPEVADKRFLPLVTRGYLARAANDLVALERITDELIRSDLPPAIAGIRVSGHMLRSDFEMLRGNQAEALKHTRLYLTFRQAAVGPSQDFERMQAREKELAAAVQAPPKDPDGDWNRDP